jgi:histidine triad (HIT) family protein
VPDSIFTRIIKREIPATIVYEDDRCLAFKDIAPQAPVHVLVVPKDPLPGLAAATAAHEALLGHLLRVSADVAKKEGVGPGFRVVVNNGEEAGQSVFHLHLHVLGGRPMKWPPG